jgi:ankyrin repeat protein
MEIVRILLLQGATIDSEDPPYGNTALHMASINGQLVHLPKSTTLYQIILLKVMQQCGERSISH